MTYNIVIPVYLGGAVVENLLTSIDVAAHHVILVDNTPDSICRKSEGKGYQIHYYPDNLGVGRAWNIGLKADLDWTFVVSQAAVFPNGFSEFLLGVNPDSDIMLSPEGWHLTGISRRAVQKIGYFDTNFYPAYLEDTDYMRRAHLAGLNTSLFLNPGVAITSVGSSSGLGTDVKFQPLHDYFIQKWGVAVDEHGGYELPFGKHGLKYFPERSVKELKNKYGYK